MNFWLSVGQWEKFLDEGTSAHRIYSSPVVWVERFGDDLLISQKKEGSIQKLLEELHEWERKVGFCAKRIFIRNLVQNSSGEKPKLYFGSESQPLNGVIQECGLSYRVDFNWHYSVGFFIDQRANRAHVKNLKPKSVLNCFAYTSSFSVAASSVGAETTSVDISKMALEKAKENFALNDINADKHYFIADDVRDVLPRFAKKGRKFDVVILDPPTFSRSQKGKVFNVEKEMDSLIESAVSCTEGKGSILVSTNCTKISAKKLETQVERVLKKMDVKGKIKLCPALPDVPDYAMPSCGWVSL